MQDRHRRDGLALGRQPRRELLAQREGVAARVERRGAGAVASEVERLDAVLQRADDPPAFGQPARGRSGGARGGRSTTRAS